MSEKLDYTPSLQNGDAEAWEEFVTTHRRGAEWIARQTLNDPNGAIDAEDVAQDAFLRMWQARNKLDHSRNLPSFLIETAHNRAVDINRHRGVLAMFSLEEFESHGDDSNVLPVFVVEQPSPEENAIQSEIGTRVREAIESATSSVQQPALSLQLKGMTQVEIARKINAPLGIVKARLRTAYKALQQPLGDLVNFGDEQSSPPEEANK